MKLAELADMAQKNITITYVPFRTPNWYARFENAEIKEGAILKGVFGNGTTPELALEDYVKEIRGSSLVFDAYRDTRKELKVPISLEL